MTRERKDEGVTNLECIVCDAFTGGSVLCHRCRAAKVFRDAAKKCDKLRPGTGELVYLLMGMAYECGRDAER